MIISKLAPKKLKRRNRAEKRMLLFYVTKNKRINEKKFKKYVRGGIRTHAHIRGPEASTCKAGKIQS